MNLNEKEGVVEHPTRQKSLRAGEVEERGEDDVHDEDKEANTPPLKRRATCDCWATGIRCQAHGAGQSRALPSAGSSMGSGRIGTAPHFA